MRALPHRLTVFALLFVPIVGAALLWLPPGKARAEGKERIALRPALLHVDDGDTVRIDWPGKDAEEIRILGIDTPEVLHLDHDLPFPQPFGDKATGFLEGCLAAATTIELLRSGNKDKYGRTLGYIYVGGKNYSELVIRARLAYGPSPRFGDNGLPEQFQACLAAAKEAGTPAFEPPWQYRKRMREVTKRMKADGTYPKGPSDNTKDAKTK